MYLKHDINPTVVEILNIDHLPMSNDAIASHYKLLDLYRVSNTILLTESVDRFFFLQNALRFSMQRQENFRLMSLKSHENKNENLYNNNTIEFRKENGNAPTYFAGKITKFNILFLKIFSFPFSFLDSIVLLLYKFSFLFS